MTSTRKRQAAVGASALLVAVTGLGVGSALGASTATADPGHGGPGGHGGHGRITNVIYLLGDGMGRTHVTAARERYYGAAGELNMEKLPAVGQVATYSIEKGSGQPGSADFAPNYVTDSASAATAWASGVKTYNAALGSTARAGSSPR